MKQISLEVKKSNPTFATASEEITKPKTKMFNNKYKDMKKTIEENLEILAQESKCFMRYFNLESEVGYYGGEYSFCLTGKGIRLHDKNPQVVKGFILGVFRTFKDIIKYEQNN